MDCKHTPGPWRVERGAELEIVSSSPLMSATVATVAARVPSVTALSDARLIAAAPELYSTLHDAWVAMPDNRANLELNGRMRALLLRVAGQRS